MLINLRSALMSGKRLPYDAEVEFLESTGTQYIATGITPASNSTVLVEGLFGTAVVASGRQFHFSDGNQNVTHYCEINNNKQYGGLGGYINQTLTRGELYSATGVFTDSDATYTINIGGTDYSATSTTATSANWRELVLFRINSSYSGNGVRVGAIKIYVNGILVRDFIPVRKGAVGYLYDRVSGKLFGNAGSGDFVLGPDRN